jgi:hypothetical protein
MRLLSGNLLNILSRRHSAPTGPAGHHENTPCGHCSTVTSIIVSWALHQKLAKVLSRVATTPILSSIRMITMYHGGDPMWERFKGEGHNRWGSLEPSCCAPGGAFLPFSQHIGSGAGPLHRFKAMVQWHMQHQSLLKHVVPKTCYWATGLKSWG